MPTQTLSTLTIRPFRADDYVEISRVHNINFAEFSMTAEEFQFEDSKRTPPCKLARWVAECDGRLVGFGEYGQLPHIYHPRKYQMHISVDPDMYGRGIGRRLYDLVVGEVKQFDPLTIDEWSRVDMAWRVGFLERRGFVEDMRMWTSAFELTRFEPSVFAEQVALV